MNFFKKIKELWKNVSVFAAIIISCVLAAVIAFGSFTAVDTGEKGVVLRFGKLAGALDEGLNFKIPLIDNVVKLSLRDTTVPIETEVSSKDIQTIKVKMNVVYALDPDGVGRVYQRYGTAYENILIVPTVLELLNSVVAEYPIDAFIEKRTKIAGKINAEFMKRVTGSGLIIKNLLLTEHDFSDEFNKAIEEKKVAEQKFLKAKYDLDRVKLEAEAQMQKQASLTDMILLEKFLDKWDGKLPTYYSGDSQGLPLIASGKK
jgi:regulator of protease activity HflC (stomatin/prohibitin superfamily)